jgi:excisionase family DNA binding protein
MSPDGTHARAGRRADCKRDKRGNDQACSARPLKFYTIQDVAEMLLVSKRTVRRWIELRKLIAHPIGGVVRIAESDLRAFIGTHRDV